MLTVAFVLSAAAVVFNPAASSLLPEVVGADVLITANSALWSAAVIAQVVALAPIAGVVIATSGGVRAAFIINASPFAISALLLIGLQAGRTPASIAARGWTGVLDGFDTVRADPLLRRVAIVQALVSLSAGATSGLLVVLSDRSLGVGPIAGTSGAWSASSSSMRREASTSNP